MGALALAAVFGLPMGTAMAAPVTVDGSSTTWDSLFDNDAYNAASDQVTVSTGVAMSDASKTLTVGNLIFGKAAGTALNNGDMAFTGSNKLTFTGGKIIAKAINIFGNTFQQLNLATVGDSQPATIHIGAAPSDKENSISAREFNYYSLTGMHLKNTTLEIAENGTFNFIPSDFSELDGISSGADGAYKGATFATYSPDAEQNYWNSKLVMTGGKLNMDASGQDGFGRIIEMGSVVITGGIVNIGGYYYDTTNAGDYNSVLYGDWAGDGTEFTIGGDAVINLYDYGTIATAYAKTTGGLDYAMDIEGGTINMLGASEDTLSVIRIGATFVERDGTKDAFNSESFSNGKLNISGGLIDVGANKFGAIISPETNMTGGAIDVKGSLIVAGNMNFQGKADTLGMIENLNGIGGGKYQWGDFTFSNGKINIGSTGVMDFATGNVDFIADGDGAFSGSLNVAEAAGTAKGTLYAKNVTVDTDGALSVDNLTLAAADKTKSLLTVNGTLIVNGALKTAGAVADSLKLAATGVLVANYGELLTQNAQGAFVLDADNAKWAEVIDATGDAKITLNSTETIQYTKAQLDALTTGDAPLLGENVAVELANGALKAEAGDPQDAVGNAIITVEEDAQSPGEVDAADVATAGGGTANEVVLDATAQTVATDKVVTVNGSKELKAKTITVSDENTTTVKISTDATISGIGGTADTILVAKGENNQAVEKIQIDGSSNTTALNLGVAGSTSQQSGKVGAVEFSGTNGGTLNVNNGQFTTGDITAATSTGSVSIAAVNTGTAAASLNTGAIDLSKANGTNAITVAKTTMSTGGQNITFGTGTSNTLTVDTGSTLNAADLAFGNATNNTVTVADSDMTVNDINFGTGASTVNVTGGTVAAADITGNSSAPVKINVGNADKAGHIVAESVTNADIVLDPAFVDGTFKDASSMAVNSITGSSVAVLQNSWFMLGSNDQAEAEAWMAKHTPGGELKIADGFYTAALALRDQFSVPATKYLEVDGGSTPYTTTVTTGNARFAANSLLLIDADAMGTETALLGTSSATLEVNDASAALKLVGAKPGTYTIAGGFGTITVTGNAWGANENAGKTLLFDTALLSGDGVATTGTTDTYKVTVTQNAAADVFPDLSNDLADMADAVVRGGDYNPNQANAGLEFVSRILSNDYIGTNDVTEAARVLEGAARVVSAAGVPTLASNLNTQVSSLIVGHNSMLNDAQPAFGSEPGQLGLWLSPFYGSSDVDGMKAGHFENGYEMNYGGAAFGLDYNISESFRLGLALNAGGGDTESEGDFNKTENDFDFWGLNLYSSYSNGAFGLTGDIGYTMLNSEITQKIPASLQEGNELKADGDSDIFTVGLTGEYRVSTASGFAVTPHAGLRYSKISTDNVDVKLAGNGGDVFEIDTDDQNLFQIPLGVKFGKDIVTDGGWTVSPSADLGVLFTMGDTDVDSKATIAGTSYSGVTNTEVVDKAAFTGALSLQAKADNGLTLGLEYGLLAGGNQTDHQLSGMLRFEF